MEILGDRPELMADLGKPGGLERSFEFLRTELSTKLEYWALARLFTSDLLGVLAQQGMTYVTGFLMLRDEQLGRMSW